MINVRLRPIRAGAMPAFCNLALVIPGPFTNTTLEHLCVLLFSSYSVILEGGGGAGILTAFVLTPVTLQAMKRYVFSRIWIDSYPNFICFVTDEIDVNDKNQKL